MTTRPAGLPLTHGTALTVGAVLGTGVIAMPALAASIAGPASLLAWLGLVVLSAPLALTFAALGARHPDGGGVATYARRAFGARASTAVGWCFYLAVPLGAYPATSFAGGYVARTVGGGQRTVVATAVGVIVLVAATNALGLRVSGRAQLVVAAVLAVLLLAAVVAALPHADRSHLTPFAPHGLASVGPAAAVLVWGFAGWEAVTSLSADYRDPRRDVPRATALAVVIVGVLYLAVVVTSVLVLGPALATSPAPLADLLAVGVGDRARPVTAVVALLLTVAAVNAYFAGGSRLGAALARDGSAPRWLAVERHGVPLRSLGLVLGGSLLTTAVITSLDVDLHSAMLLTTGSFTLVYVIGVAAALRLLPRGTWAHRTALLSLVAVVGLLVLTGVHALWGVAVAAAGVGYQELSSRRTARSNRRSASGSTSSSTAPNPTTSPGCATPAQ
ncbi:APC family permease [Angustibacter aerolatus]